jgi:aconitate hydratase
MCPEYGATIAIFPIDEMTLDYLRLTGRESRVELVEAYARAQGSFARAAMPIRLLGDDRARSRHRRAEPGRPARPQDRVSLNAKSGFKAALDSLMAGARKVAHRRAGGRAAAAAARRRGARPCEHSNTDRW